MAAQWNADAGNAAAQELDCLAYVQGILYGAAGGASISSNFAITAEWLQALAPWGKTFVDYEGAGGWCTTPSSSSCTFNGSAHQLTTTESNFRIAVYQSQSWANALKFFAQSYQNNTLMGLPAQYIEVQSPNTNWQCSFTSPDTYGTTATEGAGLSKAWTALGAINRTNLQFLLKRDLDPTANDNTPMWLNKAA
jgi:hypothetical protein